VKDTCADII